MKLYIIVPVFNESTKNIDLSLKSIYGCMELRNLEYEIIVADDYSAIPLGYLEKRYENLSVIRPDRNVGNIWIRQLAINTIEDDDCWISFLDVGDTYVPGMFFCLLTPCVERYMAIFQSFEMEFGDRPEPFYVIPNHIGMYHGNIYRLSYIKKHNIKMSREQRIVGDTNFNMQYVIHLTNDYGYSTDNEHYKIDNNVCYHMIQRNDFTQTTKSNDNGSYLYSIYDVVMYQNSDSIRELYNGNQELMRPYLKTIIANQCLECYFMGSNNHHMMDPFDRELQSYCVLFDLMQKEKITLSEITDLFEVELSYNWFSLIHTSDMKMISMSEAVSYIREQYFVWMRRKQEFDPIDLTVSITVHNTPAHKVKNCLYTIRRALACAHIDSYEILILDNNSNLDKFNYPYELNLNRMNNIIYYRLGVNESIASNRYGIIIGRGKWITFIDSDDYVTDDFFTPLVKLIDITDYNIISTGFTEWDEENDEVGEIYNDLDLPNTPAIVYENSEHGKFYRMKFLKKHNIMHKAGLTYFNDMLFNTLAKSITMKYYGEDSYKTEYTYSYHYVPSDDGLFSNAYNEIEPENYRKKKYFTGIIYLLPKVLMRLIQGYKPVIYNIDSWLARIVKYCIESYTQALANEWYYEKYAKNGAYTLYSALTLVYHTDDPDQIYQILHDACPTTITHDNIYMLYEIYEKGEV